MTPIFDDRLSKGDFSDSRSNMQAHQSFDVLAVISPPFSVFSILLMRRGPSEGLALCTQLLRDAKIFGGKDFWTCPKILASKRKS